MALPTNGFSRSTCPMPFCSTATRVRGPHSRLSHGALDGVSWALVHNNTQSACSACAGSVSARSGTSIVPSARSTVSRSIGRLTQATTSWRSAARSRPVMTPPMLPSPTTAMVLRSEFPVLDMPRQISSGLVWNRCHQRYWLKLRPTPETVGSTRPRGGCELPRRDAVAPLEMPGQRALVAEAGRQRAFGERQSALEQTAGGIEPDVDQIGMRRQPNGPLEQPDQLESGQPGGAREFIKTEIFRIARMHQFDDPACDGLACRHPLGPAAAAAMPPEQVTECVDCEFVRVHAVTAGLEHVVQAAEPVDQVRIAEHVPHEIGCRFQSETLADGIDGRPGQIERAVAPPL